MYFICWSNHGAIVKPESHMSNICDERPKLVRITTHVWVLEIIISKESSFFNVTVWNISSTVYKYRFLLYRYGITKPFVFRPFELVTMHAPINFVLSGFIVQKRITVAHILKLKTIISKKKKKEIKKAIGVKDL